MSRFGPVLLGSALLGLAACSDELSVPTPEIADAPQQGALLNRAPTIEANAQPGAVIPNEFIVTVQPGVDPAAVARSSGVRTRFIYRRAMNGFAGTMNPGVAQRLRRDPNVLAVDPDLVVTASQIAPAGGFAGIASVQSPATWGIDRTDQRNLPLNSTYNFTGRGSNVFVYIMDTGIRTTHRQFWVAPDTAVSRAVKGAGGFDAIGDGQNGNDCHGHGTHVAGTVGGLTWGIAKRVRLISVRVLNCAGSGSTSGVIAGIDWVTERHVKPAVVNMSLGGGASAPMDAALTRSVSYGVTYAVAAGNSNANACSYSPARASAAITVGATASSDARSSFSNWGTCLDVFAPGTSITSAGFSSDIASAVMSGTSMASPHVAGVAALFLENAPYALPGLVADVIRTTATPGKVTTPGTGSPNLLLNRHNGTLAGTGSFQYQPHGTYYTSTVSGYHRGYLRGSPGTNYDLRLYRWNGSSWVLVAAAVTASTLETINYFGVPGSYYWHVRSAAGGGTYDFFMRAP